VSAGGNGAHFFPALFVDGRRHFDAICVAYARENLRGVLVQHSVCRRDRLCGTDGAPASHQAMPRLPPDGRRLSALSDALRDVSARKPVATRRKSLCEPLDAYEKDSA